MRPALAPPPGLVPPVAEVVPVAPPAEVVAVAPLPTRGLNGSLAVSARAVDAGMVVVVGAAAPALPPGLVVVAPRSGATLGGASTTGGALVLPANGPPSAR